MANPARPPPARGARHPPVLVPGFGGAAWLTDDGEVLTLSLTDAAARAQASPPLLCHGKAAAARLGCQPFAAFDVLELFAFVRPAAFAVPTPVGIALALGLPLPEDPEAATVTLHRGAQGLLRELAARGEGDTARAIAWTMAQAGWAWGPAVLRALDFAAESVAPRQGAGFAVWEDLPDWRDEGPPPPPGNAAIDPEAARRRLAQLLDDEAERRPQQADYSAVVAGAFAPRDREDEPRLVLAEAGTGIGKTLGYIAPASLWSELNEAPVWISTYTRNLQQQIDSELARLYPNPAERKERVVIRKGRENYLCLLNYQEATAKLGSQGDWAVALGLMARWIARSRDGDMVGGDFPGWLPGLLGRAPTLGLADRRGECIYSACTHYGRCFIERSQRQARHAAIVVANHALVMIRAALDSGDEDAIPSHLVFDEGHHIFDAADSAFAAHLTGLEARELRRWLLGGESGTGSGSRLRGLARRLEDLITDDERAREALEEGLTAARVLPDEGWRGRVHEGRPRGACESFLAALRQQVLARDPNAESGYSLECTPSPLAPGLGEAAQRLSDRLRRIHSPLQTLRGRLKAKLEAESEDLESDARRRLDAVSRGLERRALGPLAAWRTMLANLQGAAADDYIDWFGIERVAGQERDFGYYRHWIDPTRPFAEALLRPAQGAVITSATLTDGAGDEARDWQGAQARSGAAHLASPAVCSRHASPFAYGDHSRVYIVGDLTRGDIGQLSMAYEALFLAAGGGALGLFTAIARLRAVQARLGPALEQRGIALYSQHVDGLDTATLVEIFRAELDACLLGTDAVRDGVDVPGRALRLIVFDRVPWPRPSLRHKARRKAFGGRSYDEALTRLRLKQAFGRLIRRADDRGVFVILDSRVPTRLLGAFPPEVAALRCGLAEAVAGTRDFLALEGAATNP